MKKINLTQGKVALVDDADYAWLNQWKWCAAKRGKTGHLWYAFRMAKEDGVNRGILMHRLIAGAKEGQTVDHEDRNGLNNQRRNLRECAQAKQSLNRRGNLTGRKTSRYKGVYWQKEIGRWRARFRLQYLGTFKDERVAARAYDAAAQAFDPEYAYLNFKK